MGRAHQAENETSSIEVSAKGQQVSSIFVWAVDTASVARELGQSKLV
ncbi:hypothetical protein EYZ11_000285 [Aspergillus tanneri]|uniref:Uncharacterized protein n=1 Tax=Aspergillus tanneri TaxID=1220188 RepID=A0A4S3JXH5_9EURO|nr:hypothetical protein EYZ11_000285 [Aspergillus tanneri]